MKQAASWIVQISRASVEVVIAWVLVSLTEGPFQTTVVCLLGLILQRVRYFELDSRDTGELLAFAVARAAACTKEPNDTMEQFTRSVDEKLRSMATVKSKVSVVENWILTIVFTFGLLKVCLTAIR